MQCFLKKNSELNIEGNPSINFINLVNEIKPTQVTLVPDSEDAITSNAGWDTTKNASFLSDIVKEFQLNSIRVSIFINPEIQMVEGAKKINADRIELFTGPYAKEYNIDKFIANNVNKKSPKNAPEGIIGKKKDYGRSSNSKQHNLSY